MCNSRALGRVGVEQYYCWDCCIEFVQSKKGVELFEVLDDGSLETISDFEAEMSVPKN